VPHTYIFTPVLAERTQFQQLNLFIHSPKEVQLKIYRYYKAANIPKDIKDKNMCLFAFLLAFR
jgi:hypothetical protein